MIHPTTNANAYRRRTDVPSLVVVVGEGALVEPLPEEEEELVFAGSVAVVVGRMEAAAPIPVNAAGIVGCEKWSVLFR